MLKCSLLENATLEQKTIRKWGHELFSVLDELNITEVSAQMIKPTMMLRRNQETGEDEPFPVQPYVSVVIRTKLCSKSKWREGPSVFRTDKKAGYATYSESEKDYPPSHFLITHDDAKAILIEEIRMKLQEFVDNESALISVVVGSQLYIARRNAMYTTRHSIYWLVPDDGTSPPDDPYEIEKYRTIIHDAIFRKDADPDAMIKVSLKDLQAGAEHIHAMIYENAPGIERNDQP